VEYILLIGVVVGSVFFLKKPIKSFMTDFLGGFKAKAADSTKKGSGLNYVSQKGKACSSVNGGQTCE
jgi:hypothetical protein